MSDRSNEAERRPWDPAPIIAWLLDEGRFLANVDELVSELGDRLLSAGAPVWRVRLSMRTLHPLVTAVSSVWERDSETTLSLQSPHGMEGRAGYVGSPLEIIARTGKAYRKRLEDALDDTDHNVLHDLRSRGGTDYFGLPMRFTRGANALAVFNSDTPGGFSGGDIDGFTETATILAPIVEVFNSRSVSLAVAEAYLGPRTGQRVLEGQITRGDIEKIDAAILVSDIRDWTGLNNRVAAETALALANRYFEIIAEAVEAHGGEILKFIGDGVLAVFPTEDGALDADTVCRHALAAARQALEAAQAADPPLDLRFGFGLHFGEVLYGNIGSKTRIDFTVLGQAVNVAARIEGLCGTLDRPVVFSEEFAGRLSEPTTLVAEETLKGNESVSKVFTVPDDPRSPR